MFQGKMAHVIECGGLISNLETTPAVHINGHIQAPGWLKQYVDAIYASI